MVGCIGAWPILLPAPRLWLGRQANTEISCEPPFEPWLVSCISLFDSAYFGLSGSFGTVTLSGGRSLRKSLPEPSAWRQKRVHRLPSRLAGAPVWVTIIAITTGTDLGALV